MKTMTHWQLLLATATLGLTFGCGGGDSTPDESSSAPAAPATEATEEPEAPAASTAQPEAPAPTILTEAPTGTPKNFAELCAAQRQALADGAEALGTLNGNKDDAEARADLAAALGRLSELEPLTLTMTPPDAATAEVESQALTKVRDKFGAARLKLESTPDGVLLFQEIQQAASSGD